MKYHSTERLIEDLGLINIHHVGQCQGQDCILHNPSRHNLTLAPFDAIQGDLCVYLYRICEHGYNHADPDAISYLTRVYSKHTVRDYMDRTACFDADCCDCCGWKDRP